MGKETTIVVAEVVEARRAVGYRVETVFGAASVAGKEPGALATLLGQCVALDIAEGALTLAVHHCRDAVVVDVAQTVFGKDEVVAGIDIAIVLDDGSVTAGDAHGADAGRLTNPAGQGGVEKLYEDLSYIMAYPFIEYRAGEMSELPGFDAENGQLAFAFICHGSEVTTIFMRQYAFDDGCELDILAPDLLVEVIDVERVVGIEVVDNTHCVPFYPVFLQQFNTPHDFVKGRLTTPRAAILVVELLRAVDADADKPMVVVEESAPLIGKQRTVGLQTVLDNASARVLTLQCQGTLVEADGAHQGFTAVPSEEHLWLCLRLNILTNEGFECGIAHEEVAVVGLCSI